MKVLFTSEYFRLMKYGVMEFYDSLEEALDEVPKSYKKINDYDWNKIMQNAENRKALKFTPQNVFITHAKNTEYDNGDETEILEEFFMVSNKTYKMLDFSNLKK